MLTRPARSLCSLAAKSKALPLLPPSVISIQSHVVYGAAGNSAAVFPMRRLGVDVWPIHTVQFSNHTQYGKWEGLPTPTEQISALGRGIEAIGGLSRVNAVLSGYLGTPEQGEQVLDVVARVKRTNPSALYVCDPVMGHPAKGCVVPEGVQEYHRKSSVAAADVVCPNVLELGVMTKSTPKSPADVLAAARSLLAQGGARLVLVKHLAHAGLSPEDAFEMLLISRNEAWHISTPLLPFSHHVCNLREHFPACLPYHHSSPCLFRNRREDFLPQIAFLSQVAQEDTSEFCRIVHSPCT